MRGNYPLDYSLTYNILRPLVGGHFEHVGTLNITIYLPAYRMNFGWTYSKSWLDHFHCLDLVNTASQTPDIGWKKESPYMH